MSSSSSVAETEATSSGDNNNMKKRRSILDRVRFRDARPTDICSCHEIEQASYPADEAASMSTLQYRQHHAAPYFRVAILIDPPDAADEEDDVEDNHQCSGNTDEAVSSSVVNNATTANDACAGDNDDDAVVIGFICSTRCRVMTAKSLTTHIPGGPLLAIHSIVVDEPYRRQGIATRMLQNYVHTVHQRQNNGDDPCYDSMIMADKNENWIQKIVLMAKADLLTFYVHAGFSVLRPSAIVHGGEQWYDLQLDMMQFQPSGSRTTRSSPNAPLPCYIVDAFCDPQQPHGTGNPAAIVICNGTEAAALPDDSVKEDSNVNDYWDELLTRKWMQQVAAEFNISETAFLWRLPPDAVAVTSLAPAPPPSKANGAATTGTALDAAPSTASSHHSTSSMSGMSMSDILNRQQQLDKKKVEKKKKELHFGIRYYTPIMEETFCGHATLSAAAVLYQTMDELLLDSKNETTVVFHARHDVLRVKQQPSSRETLTRITMEFPVKPAVALVEPSSTAARSMVQAALGIGLDDILYMGLSDTGDVLVEVTYESFSSLEKVNYDAFLEWDGYSRGVIICCDNPLKQRSEEGEEDGSQNGGSRGGGEVEVGDFLSRFFSPKAGILEDPVTGSAHCVLAPYFGAQLKKDHVVGHQRSIRGGVVDCQLVCSKTQPISTTSSSGSTASGDDFAGGDNYSTVKLTGSASTVVTGTLWQKR